jgi:hypothetical protein
MKTKKLSKKLGLNKKTISNLSVGELKQSKGGLPWTDPRICCQPTIYTDCYSCEITCWSYCANCTVPETIAYPCPWETQGCVTDTSCV